MRMVWTRYSNYGEEYQKPQLRNYCDDCGELIGGALKHLRLPRQAARGVADLPPAHDCSADSSLRSIAATGTRNSPIAFCPP